MGKMDKTSEYFFKDKIVEDGVIYSANGEYCYGLTEDVENMPEIKIKEGTKKIVEGAFTSCERIKKIILPSSVEAIDDLAFINSDLEEINLENVLYFGYKAFWGTNIKEATINKNATFKEKKTYFENDGAATFANCFKLKRLVYGPDTIPHSLCYGCESLSEVVLLNTVKEIGSHAFVNTKSLTSFPFQEGLSIIKDCAFSSSGIQIADFPKSLKYVGELAFLDCRSLKSIYFKSDSSETSLPLTLKRSCFSNTAISTFTVPSRTAVLEEDVLARNEFLNKLFVDAPLSALPDRLCSYDKNLEEVLIYPTIKKIGKSCFENTGLKKVDEQFANVEFFNIDAFSNCDKLKFANIRKDVSCNYGVFSDCHNLELVILNTDKIGEIFKNTPEDLIIISPFTEKDFGNSLGGHKLTYSVNEDNINVALKYMPFKEITKISEQEKQNAI